MSEGPIPLVEKLRRKGVSEKVLSEIGAECQAGSCACPYSVADFNSPPLICHRDAPKVDEDLLEVLRRAPECPCGYQIHPQAIMQAPQDGRYWYCAPCTMRAWYRARNARNATNDSARNQEVPSGIQSGDREADVPDLSGPDVPFKRGSSSGGLPVQEQLPFADND